MQGLAGQVALVTGGTSGIGKATVVALAKAGAHVVLTGRREAEGQKVAEEARAAGRSHGVKIVFVQGDVTDEAHIKQAVETAKGLTGKLKFAFNNAGVELGGVATTENTVENYRKVFDTNVLGVFLSLKHQIPALISSGGGSIVNTSSVAGSIAMPGASVYVASKHAVIGLTKSAALEVAKNNVRINTISPAAIDTDMLTRFTGNRDPGAIAWLTGLHPIGRLGKVEEIAQPVLFLLSDDASYITGTDLPVDGGLMAQ